jgi:DNA repair protein RadC
MNEPHQYSLVLEPIVDRRRDMDPVDRELIERAIRCLEARYLVHRDAIASPQTVKDFLRLQLGGVPYEVFAVLWLDGRNRLIRFQELFRGTINGASVHPREVARNAIAHNAAASIFAHNHPSGVAEPSHADLRITEKLRETLDLLDVRVLDHLIIGDSGICSFAELGLAGL